VAAAFWAALSHRVYSRTLPVGLLEHLFGEDDGGWQSAAFALRKLYSVVAFTLIGFLVHKALPATGHPAARAAVIVAGVSALIEVAQKARHAHEGVASNLFDILCGAFGGWLAVTIARALKRRA
jgi:hypothetical protein